MMPALLLASDSSPSPRPPRAAPCPRLSSLRYLPASGLDRTVIVSLAAIEAIHVDWRSGAQIPGQSTPADTLRQMELTPGAITAAMIGVNSRLQIFALQRWINEYPEEPLLAVLPGVALQELWAIVGVAETALIGVSVMVVVTALLGMAAMILSGLNERRREMAILRAVGARPLVIVGLLMLEATVMAAIGAVLGMVLLYLGLVFAQPYIDAGEGLVLLVVMLAGAASSLIPALRAYRLSLADGMTVRA
jgi:putative ABC transport system permease protein